jgi:hypothetical protein
MLSVLINIFFFLRFVEVGVPRRTEFFFLEKKRILRFETKQHLPFCAHPIVRGACTALRQMCCSKTRALRTDFFLLMLSQKVDNETFPI